MPPIHSSNADGDSDANTYYTTVSDAKRRKTRKGTRSCWACKRRKEKCIFGSGTSTTLKRTTICLGCQRRGTRCVSQEFPDDDVSVPPDGARQMGDRMVRLEAMVEELVNRLGSDNARVGCPPASNPTSMRRRDNEIPTPASIELESTQYVAQSRDRPAGLDTSIETPRENPSSVSEVTHLTNDQFARLQRATDIPTSQQKLLKLSQMLHEMLPPLEDSGIICKASYRSFYMFDEVLTVPYTTLNQGGSKSPEDILVRPGIDAHPVLIAKYMLQLAHIMQQFPLSIREELRGLSESPQEMLERLADAAISLVSTQEKLLGSIEGLECVMLEGMYYANCGNLRLSWAACRRAMHLAQLMGFHLPSSRLRYRMLNPNTKADPRYMWYRIVHYDRYLCIMLGLPQGSNDCSMATDAMFENDTPLGRLERMHCVLVAKILERNESDARSGDSALTEELDRELQKAAKSLPSRWWLIPDLRNTEKNDEGLFWDLKRLVTQMYHYNILNRLHLPYMLRSSDDRQYEYFKVACVNASREILSRFIVLRNFNRIAINCRTSDFVALMAAMTLILAHLDSHRQFSRASNFLAHQYLSDRAMMEQVQETMEELSRLNADIFSAECADLLNRLLAIEAEAADGLGGHVEGVRVETQKTGVAEKTENEASDGIVSVTIPYFGIIKITCEGISKETPKSSHIPHESRNSEIRLLSEMGNVGNVGGVGVAELSTPAQSRSRNAFYTTVNNPNFVQLEPQTPSSLFDLPLPGLTAGVDDWTFQGVDTAFFDSLMGTADDNGYVGVEGQISK
ncbi:uncharacterized protein F4822DRAFT_360787 [Hypoxylon trugodes]|uniref:uncharacterized protein n=1 Tax=Hypoxylon trugodes TaxID=326681 RepID=UPI002199C54E|nr:uncharacterized protein F4822DRAFT_360787 [Hypoxylon trugodes]KAI1386034.1 hypothetical protein F4822DRAFT_360787 [Hypoxylon trugodes]